MTTFMTLSGPVHSDPVQRAVDCRCICHRHHLHELYELCVSPLFLNASLTKNGQLCNICSVRALMTLFDALTGCPNPLKDRTSCQLCFLPRCYLQKQPSPCMLGKFTRQQVIHLLSSLSLKVVIFIGMKTHIVARKIIFFQHRNVLWTHHNTQLSHSLPFRFSWNILNSVFAFLFLWDNLGEIRVPKHTMSKVEAEINSAGKHKVPLWDWLRLLDLLVLPRYNF